MRSLRLFAVLAAGLVLSALTPALGFAQEQTDPRAFPETGYTVSDDAIWSFFTTHGGSATFGAPISRELTLLDSQVQLFENAAVQLMPDGSVQVLQLTGAGLLPFQHLDGLTVPAADPAVAFVTPNPDQPNYAARLAAFLNATVAPQFQSAYAQDVWGLPTSSAKADPRNPSFVYQRFQNGILMYDAGTGSVDALPVGTWFKAILTGKDVPSDLAAQAAASPFYKQLTAAEAFVPDAY